MEKYDVVVAGSGIGGLAAGALLAKYGYKVLITESLGEWAAGSRLSSRKDSEYRPGAVAIARRSVIDQMFKEVGAELDAPR